ncbi:RDD family protein [Halosimplex pelagicum]|uniref:RDD family protein n=1 Tax=Halosimplex pelagicum TaxID=869886 RepID=A0A7D5T3C4_9EURY|nr:RDD family protein [Halosimplex pelagicum]QLH80628.1 RDD family protein [Halosimplex pelagicum]
MDDSFERCGPGIRGVAMAIDAVVWFALLFVAIYPIAALTGDITTTSEGVDASLSGTPGLVAFVLWFALALGYHTLAEWRYGRTIGKALVKIRVTGGDGSPPSLRAAAVRNVLRLVDWLPAFYVVGILAVFASGESRRIGDRVAGTAVVR